MSSWIVNFIAALIGAVVISVFFDAPTWAAAMYAGILMANYTLMDRLPPRPRS